MPLGTGLARKILDQFSFYSYKDTFGTGEMPQTKFQQWVDPEDRRRLDAYALLESYFRNMGREWMNKAATDDDRKARREYGDPHLLVHTTLSSLLGNQQQIVVDGAIVDDGVVAEGEGEADTTTNAAAIAQQELLEAWAIKEKFELKLVECEREAIKLGDGVFVLGWDAKAKRPRLSVYNPGFYFPRFDPVNQGAEDYPEEVCIAYEYEDRDPDNTKDTVIFVRRIRWRLVEFEKPVAMPWNEGEEQFYNCEYTDAIWLRDDIDDDVFHFDMTKVYEWISGTNDLEESGGPVWLDIDFIPVVHIPNTIALQNHFGDSILGPVMQILDDIMATDSDIQAAAATTGTPPIGVTGVALGKTVPSYGPGTILPLGDQGRATVIDTSMGLKALIELKNSLLERLSVNSRTPESLLGRVKPNEVPSGIALTLSFTPHIGMIVEMRKVRRQKHALLLKFVTRFYMLAKQLATAFPVELKLGSFLPADKQEAMTIVMNLYSSKAISLETAVTMLAEAGYPIEDWVLEIERIQSRDFTSANDLALITGNVNDALDYLGMDRIPESELIDPDEVEEGDPTGA